MLYLPNRSNERRFTLRPSNKSYLLWFLVAVILAAIIFSLRPNDTLPESLLESLLLAVSGLACYGASNRCGSGLGNQQHGGGPWLMVAYLGLAGVAQLVFSLFEDGAVRELWVAVSNEPAELAILVGGLAAACIFTGIFEECLMRGLLFPAIEDRYKPSRNAAVIAACVSSLVFGLLHVAGDLTIALEMDVIFQLSVLAKIAQASFFGFVMCSIFKTHGIAWCIAAHALFDFIVFLPGAMALEAPAASYATSSLPGLLGILCSTLLLIPPVLRSYQVLAHNPE